MANRLPRISAASLLAALLFWAAQAMAAGAGVVTHLAGTLSVKRADGTTKLLAVKSEVFQGDVLSTERETYARVKFVDGGEIVLRPASQLKLDTYAFSESQAAGDGSVMSLLKGGFRAVTGLIGKRNHDSVRYNTPTATIGIRGTDVGIQYVPPFDPNSGVPAPNTLSGDPAEPGTYLNTHSGSAELRNQGGSIVVGAGQSGFAGFNTEPKFLPRPQSMDSSIPGNINKDKGNGQGIGRDKDTNCNP